MRNNSARYTIGSAPRQRAHQVVQRLLILGSAVLLFLGAPVAAGADTLVLHNGDQVQTKGPYEIRGGRVVYTSPSGALLSIRSTEVDFAATETLAKPAEASAAAPTVATHVTRPVVATITNRDVGTTKRNTPVAQPEDVSSAQAVAAAPAPNNAAGHRLVVTESSDQIGDQGYLLSGTLVNQGNATAVQIRVNAILLDVDGNTLEAGTTALDGMRLEPGDSAPFAIALESAPAYDTVRFDIASVPLLRRAPDPPANNDPSSTNDGEVSADVEPPSAPPV